MKKIISNHWQLVMAALLILTAFLLAENAQALEIDPTITPTKTLVCEYPVTREDGSALALDEIAKVKAYGGSQAGSYDIVVGENATACRVLVDFAEVPDGTYYYTMTVIDTAGRESQFYTPAEQVVVKRIAPPGAVQNLRWE